MDLEMIIMNIINYSGEARSLCMEGISYAKKGDFDKARTNIEDANEKIACAHKSQTKLIQSEAQGEKQDFSLLLVHAQDHLMNAITTRDMAREFIDLYEVVHSSIVAGGSRVNA
ncbi:phosphotransferase system (PTS) lichenan-specific enzyme IIA component [[Clostridium] ultunense Esp]|uniref:Phosphotransferase system (PTS) lichenan-specific enzyme IIA component n=1 Tax=[Clostridium] ultunense Esp TaxID=1288971 RepID=M1ZIH6_9FIRM|nr:PTS lactose/cellobiose transporter subunit IIA [Schnuerera ultunensis]CCQ98228.1 phosphotransferase system (PTS) lichenan-specific enzyme IIA component [[Clostridium] ultunense Esp]SHD78642.1 phosphotransferase system (PTS) lichenan-specific enzyme IIA component [[Clostridium] ultunense Esp]